MEIVSHTECNDIKIIKAFSSEDVRGGFTKFFHHDTFVQAGIEMDIKEVYYSVSQRNVIRGMHFQLPPYDHAKLVHVISGSAIDVVVDLRKNSATYKKCIVVPLNGEMKQAVYIPKGFAHGFKALEDGTVMQYSVSTVYNREADFGIRYDSIGFNWNCEGVIVSERDSEFIGLEEFDSPF